MLRSTTKLVNAVGTRHITIFSTYKILALSRSWIINRFLDTKNNYAQVINKTSDLGVAMSI